jgi:hypothetical protein
MFEGERAHEAAVHVGGGIAKRTAYHARKAAEREARAHDADESVDAVAAYSETIVRVSADSISVGVDGPNYRPKLNIPSKRKRRARQREDLREKQKQMHQRELHDAGDGTDEDDIPDDEDGEVDTTMADLPGQLEPAVTFNLYDALEDEDDMGEEGTGGLPLKELLLPLSNAMSEALRQIRRRLSEYLCAQAASGKSVAMVRAASGGLYPSRNWTIQFGKWYVCTRLRTSRASKWIESGRAKPCVQRTTRGRCTVFAHLQHIKNHLWRELWPAMPEGGDATTYWHVVLRQVMACFDGGGGGMAEMATSSANKAMARARTACASDANVTAAGAVARKRTMDALRAGTTTPCTREHLYQPGEYQLQDALLSDPYHVNLNYVANGYMTFSRTTGCRPGMAVNDRTDAADPAGHWYELPPLSMGLIQISPDAYRMSVDNPDGVTESLLRMETKFERKKGEYFASYDFGTSVTPDSDE